MENCIEHTYHWPENGESRPWTEFWITTTVSSVGQTRKATLLYSVDGGNSWKDREMERNCFLGDKEVWHINLGTFPAGTRIQYAVEIVTLNGQSMWDNAFGKDYHAVIGNLKDREGLEESQLA